MSTTSERGGQRMNARRAARLAAREQQRQREFRRRRFRTLMWVGGALLVVLGVALLVYRSVEGQPGRFVASQGQAHIDRGQQHAAYNSRPATSGPHWSIAGEAPAPWGIHKDPLPDEVLVHNLEHGGVGIHYNCRDCPELVAQLEGFYNRWVPQNQLTMFPNSSKIIVSPYYDMPRRIALTAWTRIDEFDEYDEARIIRFIEAFRNKGPEMAP